MKKLLLAVGILFVISCTKENNRTSNDCKDCTWSVYNRTTKQLVETQDFEDWNTSPTRQMPTYCKWLDALKQTYPTNVNGNDSITYSCN